MGTDRVLPQIRHLVLHQGDQGRDPHADTVTDHGRDLKAKGFAAAGGHERENITAGQQGVDDGFLIIQKVRVTENLLEDRLGGLALLFGIDCFGILSYPFSSEGDILKR